MKNRKTAAFAAAAVVLLLAACSSKPETVLSSEEIVVPELSSEDLLVSSLEYLLEDGQAPEEQAPDDGKIEETQEQEPSEEKDGPQSPAVPADQQEETEGKKEAVIYYGSGGASELNKEMIETEEITPDVLVDALARHNIVSLLDTKVVSFEEQERDGQQVLYLDLSKAFGEYLRTMSVEAECIIVASVTNTFLENYGADAIYLTVEGETLATSNAEYAAALVRCTPEEVLAIMNAGN